jgi:hypothetical protein
MRTKKAQKYHVQRTYPVVDELAQGSSRSPNGKRRLVAFGKVALVDEPRNDMPGLNVEIVMRPINIGRNDRGEVTAVFLGVGSAHGINEPLGVGISLVTGVRWSVMQHGLVDGIGGLIGEYAGAEETDEFLDLVDAAAFHDIVVDENVLAKELHLLTHVGKEAPHFGRQVNHVRRLVGLEDLLRVLAVAQIPVLGTQVDPRFVRFGTRLFDVVLDGSTHQTRTARHHHHYLAIAIIGIGFTHDGYWWDNIMILDQTNNGVVIKTPHNIQYFSTSYSTCSYSE